MSVRLRIVYPLRDYSADDLRTREVVLYHVGPLGAPVRLTPVQLTKRRRTFEVVYRPSEPVASEG